MNIPLALTIAGSDSSAGAGMQADLKTFEEYGVYGMVALTAIVTMNPDNSWAHDVTGIEPPLIEKQLKTILAGKKIDAMKTGMLANADMVKLVHKTITENNLKNVVIDPVMVCKGDDRVLNPENADAMRDLLLPVATVVTPNLFEAGILSGMGKLSNLEDMKKAAIEINKKGAANVVIKGGKALAGNEAADLFYDGANFEILTAPKITHTYNHGAGCTFAAAITAGLAAGLSVKNAVFKAKDFVTAAIKNGFAFNEFVGPVFHGAYRLCKTPV
ncbi:MAG: bifunctional hydroxymethylpyrimidine kinase/phosphomethylpyrimidine kinase [Clostridiales bacterium]|jgi:pyridoxine kinase|nr:bifunctional hydroxymethylpyrimidine kinase/phosphomethylpyrimidine kinase [Clostridiales bacterium]